jgi:hypothetical protein
VAPHQHAGLVCVGCSPGVYHLLRRDLGARPSYGRQKVGYGAEIADFVALSRDCRRSRARGLVQGIGDGAFPALPVPMPRQPSLVATDGARQRVSGGCERCTAATIRSAPMQGPTSAGRRCGHENAIPAKARLDEIRPGPPMTLGAAAPASGPTTPGASACCGGSIRFEYEKVQPDLPGDRSMTVPRWPR